MRDAATGDRALEGRGHVRLHRNSGERFGPVFPSEGERHQAVVTRGPRGAGGDEKRGPVVPAAIRERLPPAQYSRPDEATKDTTCRCYLRGPDGISGLTPSGTWSISKLPPGSSRYNHSRPLLVRNSRQGT